MKSLETKIEVGYRSIIPRASGTEHDARTHWPASVCIIVLLHIHCASVGAHVDFKTAAVRHGICEKEKLVAYSSGFV